MVKSDSALFELPLKPEYHGHPVSAFEAVDRYAHTVCQLRQIVGCNGAFFRKRIL
jgi:hypothetical protein